VSTRPSGQRHGEPRACVSCVCLVFPAICPCSVYLLCPCPSAFFHSRASERLHVYSRCGTTSPTLYIHEERLVFVLYSSLALHLFKLYTLFSLHIESTVKRTLNWLSVERWLVVFGCVYTSSHAFLFSGILCRWMSPTWFVGHCFAWLYGSYPPRLQPSPDTK
jgi:hypothetical protein